MPPPSNSIGFLRGHGADGWRQLAGSLEYLRQQHPDILTISDAKRSDIGNTSAAYARAIFGELGFDAVTLNPYLGRDALQPFSITKRRLHHPLSHLESRLGDIQNLIAGDRPLWQHVAEKVQSEWNAKGNCMMVASGTNPARNGGDSRHRRRYDAARAGIGAQGGEVEAVLRAGLNSAGRGLIINSSRGIIFAEDPAAAAAELRQAINAGRPQSVLAASNLTADSPAAHRIANRLRYPNSSAPLTSESSTDVIERPAKTRRFEKTSMLPATLDAIVRFHEDPRALARLTPPPSSCNASR